MPKAPSPKKTQEKASGQQGNPKTKAASSFSKKNNEKNTTAEGASGAKAHSASTVSVDSTEASAIRNYTGESYVGINKNLRRGEKVPKDLENDVRQLDRVFSRSSTSEDMTVYRGMSVDFASKLEKGSSFTDNGFTSTTSKKSVAETFKKGKDNVLMEVRVPKGSKAVSLKKHSEYGSEDEILINRGSKYRVIESKQVGWQKQIVVEVVQ